jgi:2-polyprenyl-3-methyl-5-hydroxy-6-metoxy-1,4-benzoquinol methylase
MIILALMKPHTHKMGYYPQKINYLIRTIIHYLDKPVCPSCHSKDCKVIDRKYLFSRLVECKNCHLYFRLPVDSVEKNKEFYQEEYQQKGEGITTDIPSPDKLEELKKNRFLGTPKNIDTYIYLFKQLFNRNETIKIIDFGANWGYHSYQFKEAGFKVSSYEISVPRANLGKKLLGVDIKTNTDELPDNNDLFFSSHVIEHLPDIPFMINLAKKLLNEDGMFVAECPNGSKEFREKNPKAFHLCWGLLHPNYISADYYKFMFKQNPYFITSTPLNIEEVLNWNRNSQVCKNLSGDQLVIFTLPNKII